MQGWHKPSVTSVTASSLIVWRKEGPIVLLEGCAHAEASLLFSASAGSKDQGRSSTCSVPQTQVCLLLLGPSGGQGEKGQSTTPQAMQGQCTFLSYASTGSGSEKTEEAAPALPGGGQVGQGRASHPHIGPPLAPRPALILSALCKIQGCITRSWLLSN